MKLEKAAKPVSVPVGKETPPKQFAPNRTSSNPQIPIVSNEGYPLNNQWYKKSYDASSVDREGIKTYARFYNIGDKEYVIFDKSNEELKPYAFKETDNTYFIQYGAPVTIEGTKYTTVSWVKDRLPY